MKIKLILLTILSVFIGCLIGCNNNSENIDNNKIYSNEIEKSTIQVFEYIDPETGVHYLLTYNGGITPRLDNNGKIIIDKK